ncbi:MAG: efflux RND transporter periplasmic adaptor subunit [Gammaproteobacteria bacterium]
MTGERNNFFQAWLDLQCRHIEGLQQGFLLLGKSERGPFQPVAAWPASSATPAALNIVAVAALREGGPIIRPLKSEAAGSSPAGQILAAPLPPEMGFCGVVVVVQDPGSEAQGATSLQQLVANLAWLKLPQPQTRPGESSSSQSFELAVEVMAAGAANADCRTAAQSMMAKLADLLDLQQVSFGVVEGGVARILAVSDRAQVTDKPNLHKPEVAAMHEAIDSRRPFAYSGGDEESMGSAHERLSEHTGNQSIYSVPFVSDEHFAGALLFQAKDSGSFDAARVASCDLCAALVGPLLYDKYLLDQPAHQRLRREFGKVFEKVLGSGYLLAKAAALGLAALVLLLQWISVDYRVTADARVEGLVQRAIVAPIDGYISEAMRRAGDQVEAGELIARLDDRDLSLQERQLVSEQAQLSGEYREAMSLRDDAEVSILRARLDRVAAQLDLVREQLARTRITAPLAGVLVQGDLSQSLGAPVERGDPLFEVAPLSGYRVLLQVDERDIGLLSPDATGHMALVGMPDSRLPIQVERITPISTSEDGHNFFTVEARLQTTEASLRPGMQGVGKLYVGERSLGWVWTHRLVNWIQLSTWSWSV